MPKFETCRPFVGFHATSAEFDTFDPAIGGAQFHVGTASQATMRGGKDSVLLMVSVYATTLIRKKDKGGGWKRPTPREAESADGVVYLNRFEGIPLHRLDALGGTADRLSDAEFIARAPEARDSYGIFQAHNCRIIERIAWNSERHAQLLDYDRRCSRSLTERIAPYPLVPSQDTIERAKAFCLTQWRREQNDPECDLSDCRALAAQFAQEVFGGALIGNTQHQFVRLHDGDILDIALDCHAVRNGDVPYDIEQDLTPSEAFASDKRLERWLTGFAKEEKLHALSLSQKKTPQRTSDAPSPA